MAESITEMYRFYIDSQDYYSIKLYIDDVLVINTLNMSICFADYQLIEGNLHSIVIEYIEKRG